MSVNDFTEAIKPYFSHIPKKSSSGVSALKGIASYLDLIFSEPSSLLVFASSGMFSTEGKLIAIGEGRVAALSFGFNPDDGDSFSISGVVEAASSVRQLEIEPASTAFASRDDVEVRPVVKILFDGFGEITIGRGQDVEFSAERENTSDGVRLRALIDALK